MSSTDKILAKASKRGKGSKSEQRDSVSSDYNAKIKEMQEREFRLRQKREHDILIEREHDEHTY